MSINHAILGILSCKPQTGYDMKKVMQDSPFMYWSGNNNQIYKALVELHEAGLVTNELCHQDSAPSKKVYSITDSGLNELRRWSLETPQAPESKNAFLIQLAWTWQSSPGEIEDLLSRYQREVEGRLFIIKAQAGRFAPARTTRETDIWKLIGVNVQAQYEQELTWLGEVRSTIRKHAEDEAKQRAKPTKQNGQEENGQKESKTAMNEQWIEKEQGPYLYLQPEGTLIQTERDGLDLVALCAQHGTNRLLVPSQRLSEDFFRLRTGLAGAILQKFEQYNIKLAVVLDRECIKGKFEDFLLESNRGNRFNAYMSMEEAESWLLRNT